MILTYASALTVDQKNILDGNMAAPVGGILAQAVETIAIKIDGVLKTDNSRETVSVDGISFKTVSLQIVDGLGQDVTTNGEAVTIDPSCVCPINTLDGTLINGLFDVILGPSRQRGNVTLNIAVVGYPIRTLSVSFR